MVTGNTDVRNNFYKFTLEHGLSAEIRHYMDFDYSLLNIWKFILFGHGTPCPYMNEIIIFFSLTFVPTLCLCG
jgi:hypothetical protein